MRTSLKLFGALALMCSLTAWAGPKKKGTPATAKPPVAAPAEKKGPPSVNVGNRPPAGASEQSADAAPVQSRGPTRIDFDDRLIQGQTNKSGAVYLYDRKELKTRSMIKKRESFRDEIVGSLYDS